MDRISKSLGRRKFLKKGIAWGALAVSFPLGKFIYFILPGADRNFQRHVLFPDESQGKLLKMARKYGGEFGALKGGL